MYLRTLAIYADWYDYSSRALGLPGPATGIDICGVLDERKQLHARSWNPIVLSYSMSYFIRIGRQQ